MPTFIIAIFLSAFLLFQVQPIIARYILPWYGGSPAVWTTCMLCFQIGLLAGYAYAHVLATFFRNRPRRQAAIHLALVALSFALLPITPAEGLKPAATAEPTWSIINLLLRSVGLPFLVISASGPLMQHWSATAFQGRSPYRLYSISNAGSLIGLITYPFLVEPLIGLRLQTQVWSASYLAYGILAALCAWEFLRRAPTDMGKEAPASESTTSPSARDRLLWGTFAALGSVLLLAATNQMCQDIAVVPFLWVLPLGLYLLTFVISFDHARWYRRDVWIPLAFITTGVLTYLLNQDFTGFDLSLVLQIAIYTGAMFTCCMVCHGEMVRLKPAPRFLTSFYLVVAFGGALGGLLVSQVAPRIFIGYWELHAGLAGLAVIVTYTVAKDVLPSQRPLLSWKITLGLLWTTAAVTIACFLCHHIATQQENALASSRGFYGVLRVYEENSGTRHRWRILRHGRINHGAQLLGDEKLRALPSTYYTEDSGSGLAFAYHPNRLTETRKPMRIGVVGLGIGALAHYALEGDSIRFYEINPGVETMARRYFTYLEECIGEVSVIPGDARISLEAELARGEDQDFDLLFLDAFSGDSIPIHLLTLEAFSLYLEHLHSSGILAVHITNRHLDLSNPVRILARKLNLETLWIDRKPSLPGEYSSSWVLLSRNPDSLREIVQKGRGSSWALDEPLPILWTDDHSNLLEVIDRN